MTCKAELQCSHPQGLEKTFALNFLSNNNILSFKTVTKKITKHKTSVMQSLPACAEPAAPSEEENWF